MKKFLLLFLIFPCLLASANEITEDYFDIAADYCIYGKYQDAIVYLNKIIQIEPDNKEAIELKNTLLRNSNPNLESYLNSTNPILKKAAQYKKTGDKKNEILTLSKNEFWPTYFLAQHYYDNNDFANSITYFNKAISLQPNFMQSYLELAKSYNAQKQYKEAIEVLNKYISHRNSSDIAYAMRSEANLNLNYLEEAKNDIEKALNIEENISYLLLQAKILYYRGEYDKARESLNLLSRNIQTAEVYKYIGLCDLAQNDFLNALLNFDKAIILSDDDKDLLSSYNNIKNMLDKK